MAKYNDEDFLVLYPGRYTEKELPAVQKYLAECKRINDRGLIDIEALVAGTLPEDTPGIGPSVPVTKEMIEYNNAKYEQENPLFNDPEYAKKAGYPDVPVYFTFAANDDVYTAAYPPEVRDTLCVSQISHHVEHLTDIHPGDTLYLVCDYRDIIDLTPEEGSIYRSLAMHQEGTIYNQRGEVVNKVRFTLQESVRIFKEGKKPENMGFPEIWDAPDWMTREEHYYTDEDYEWMKGIWRAEKIRGSEPLYWDDVKIGDQPTPVLEGPIIESVLPTAPYGMGIGGTRTMKKEILDDEIFKTMIKREGDGIYVLPDKKDYTPKIPEGVEVVMSIDDGRTVDDEEEGAINTADIHSGTEEEGAINTADIHSVTDERAALINFYERDVAIHHINNWMGDAGRIASISWGIMAPENHAAYGKPVPTSPNYVDYLGQIQVPGLTGMKVNSHGLTKDIALVKSVVVDKYVKLGLPIVRLIWWVEEIGGTIYCEGDAEVQLPLK